MIRIFIIICLIQLTLLACGPDCYDTNKSQKLEDFLNKKWKNDLIFNTNYQDIKSYYHGLGHSDDSIRTFKLLIKKMNLIFMINMAQETI